jgi:hypothetical protein
LISDRGVNHRDEDGFGPGVCTEGVVLVVDKMVEWRAVHIVEAVPIEPAFTCVLVLRILICCCLIADRVNRRNKDGFGPGVCTEWVVLAVDKMVEWRAMCIMEAVPIEPTFACVLVSRILICCCLIADRGVNRHDEDGFGPGVCTEWVVLVVDKMVEQDMLCAALWRWSCLLLELSCHEY